MCGGSASAPDLASAVTESAAAFFRPHCCEPRSAQVQGGYKWVGECVRFKQKTGRRPIKGRDAPYVAEANMDGMEEKIPNAA